ncbi:hypothetical protein D3C76_1131680 [compost metagenome]
MRPFARPVDQRRLIIFGIDADEGGQVDDTAHTRRRPEADQGQNIRPIPWFKIPIDGRKPQGLQHILVDDAVLRIQEGIHQVADHHHGQEAGQDNQSLVHLGEKADPQLVQTDGYSHGQRHTAEDEKEVVQDRVADGGPQVGGLEQEGEIVQADPRAEENAVAVIDGFEGDDDAEHGQIGIDRHHSQGGQQHQEQRPVFDDITGLSGDEGSVGRSGKQCFRADS